MASTGEAAGPIGAIVQPFQRPQDYPSDQWPA